MTTRNRELASIIDASGNITASGNLTVSGTTTAVSSTNTTVSDPLIELNSGASSNSNDLGFVFERGSTGNNAALIWDESNDTFALGTTTATGSSTGNMSISAAGITLSTINGLTYPTSDGSANQVLKTDGSGALSFTNPTVTSIAVENESGNGSTTAFTLSADPGTENNTQVYIDGVYQFKNTYTVSGTTLTFDTAPANGASIEIIAITAGSLNNPADDTVSTAKIQNNAVTADKIVANAVGISELNVSDGSNGQVLTTNGSGTLSFTSKTASLTGVDDQSSSNDDQITITDTAVVINEDSDDVDFRVESNGQTHTLFVDGALDNIGIGYSAAHTATNKGLVILTGDGNGGIQLNKEDGSYPSSGETLGSIGWKGADSANSNAAAGASIVGIAAEDFSGSTEATNLAFNTKPSGTGPGSAPSERMRIDSSGKVGIGETSPDKQLHIKNTATGDTGIVIENTNNAQNLDIDFYNNSGSAQGRIRYAEGAGSFELNPNVSGSSPFAILYGGNVGIGTDSPDETLTVSSSSAVAGKFLGEGGPHGLVIGGNDAGFGYIGHVSSGSYDLAIDSSGKVGIRDTTPDAVLKVNSTGGGSELAFKVADASDNMVFEIQGGGTANFNYGPVSIGGHLKVAATKKIFLDGGSDTFLSEYSANEFEIQTGGARRFALSGGNLFHTGSINSNHSFSDERLKENIVVIPNALEKVSSLRGITFIRKDDGSVGTGLIAQELEKVLPEAVYESKTIDTLENPDAEEYKAINYGNTVGLLVEAIKEQQTIIEDLQIQINELKGK